MSLSNVSVEHGPITDYKSNSTELHQNNYHHQHPSYGHDIRSHSSPLRTQRRCLSQQTVVPVTRFDSVQHDCFSLIRHSFDNIRDESDRRTPHHSTPITSQQQQQHHHHHHHHHPQHYANHLNVSSTVVPSSSFHFGQTKSLPDIVESPLLKDYTEPIGDNITRTVQLTGTSATRTDNKLFIDDKSAECDGIDERIFSSGFDAITVDRFYTKTDIFGGHVNGRKMPTVTAAGVESDEHSDENDEDEDGNEDENKNNSNDHNHNHKHDMNSVHLNSMVDLDSNGGGGGGGGDNDCGIGLGGNDPNSGPEYSRPPPTPVSNNNNLHKEINNTNGGSGVGGGNVDTNYSNNYNDQQSRGTTTKATVVINSNDLRRVSKNDREGLDPHSLMFRDGRRKIDMVLCFEEENEGVMTEAEARRREQRRIFQESLAKEGLELELEDKSLAFDEKTYFLKIHIPWRAETRYAEVMNLKLPAKRFITISVKAWDEASLDGRKPNFWMNTWNWMRNVCEYNHSLIEKEPSFYSAMENGNPEEQFIVKDRYTSFTSAQRSQIVMQILLRAKYDDTEKAGIRRLLNDNTYLACYPLHEGSYSSGPTFDRRLLYLEWANPGKWYKEQPLCLVRKYFGEKIAVYFCWLGFYTRMLVFPAIIGTLCFIYGLATMNSDDNTPSKEICDGTGVGNITLCPLCDKACSYQKLSESCLFSQMTYLFDNPSTVFFAIFMSFWATTFLELWKRKQSVIVWEWDLHNIETDEENRPEFETTVKTFRTNPVTREKEPYMPTWSRAIRFIASGSAVLFMISIVLGAVLGTIIYRISLVAVIYSGGTHFFRAHAKILTTITAALINLVIIMCLTRIYHKLAITLTNLENPRTQIEYEDSFTFKIFLFEFMNFYSSLIYIAFFKGRFFDYPGDSQARKSEFFRLKADICDPAGCLNELCIQLAIIMIGKQCWNNFMEFLFPKMYNWWRQRKHKKQTKDESHLHMTWEQDYHLQDPGRLALFDEYLEMIIQYGFVTLFVAAFPLAPLFALLNNVAEIRLDAYKMVTQSRRPLAERMGDIGAWYGILKIITYTAVVFNAFVIAYTSDFIPRMVYKYVYSGNYNLVGYIDHSLASFKTTDYKEEWGAGSAELDPDICQYRGYRNGPDHEDPYGLSPHYWHVFAARLAFVVIFEHIVFVLTGIMQFIIPDVPVEVKTQIQREQLLAKEAKYQHGIRIGSDQEDSITNVREQSNNNRQGIRGNWARRLSRMSNELDAHVDIPVVKQHRRSVESTVFEFA